MFNAKNMTKKTSRYAKKYQKWAIKSIKDTIRDAANNGDSWIFINKKNSDIDEDMANEIAKYLIAHGFKVDNHEGYSYIEISWGE